jgi:hypothetical protein
MGNLVVTVVKASIRLPLAVLGEARKAVDSALGRSHPSERDAKEPEIEELREEIQEGVREEIQDAIETVRMGERIREQTVTADDVPIQGVT